MINRPALKYPGSKFAAAKKILPLLPPHDYYVEPFGGGASILLQKAPCKIETYNDLSGDVVNFFRVLRDNPDELIRKIELTPFSREEFNLSYENCADDIERARRLFVRCWQSHTPRIAVNTGWASRGAEREKRSSTSDFCNIGHLHDIARRLKRVQIENDEAINVIQKYAKYSDTLVYCDPPYIDASHKYKNAYEFGLSEDGHICLSETLSKLNCRVMVSGYASDLYDKLYKDWYVHSFSANASRNQSRTEVVWMNFAPSSLLPIFY